MKRTISLVLAVLLIVTAFAGCGGTSGSSSTPAPSPTKAADNSTTTTDTSNETPTEDGKPDTWIADRQIEGRVFLENDGAWLPADQQNSPVWAEVKRLTGISANWKSTGANDGLEELTLALAAKDVPEIIVNYIDHSGRPEASVLFKAASQGMFEDISSYLADTQVYKQYNDRNFLPQDTYDGIVHRPEFNGAVYIMHMNIGRPKEASDVKFDGQQSDLKVRRDIYESLGVKSKDIRTWEDFLDYCQKIYDGGFTDANSRPVYVIGPRVWGGKPVSTVYRPFDWGNGTRFGVVDGKIMHTAETEWAMKQVKAMRTLIEKDFLHPEFFTMENTRAEEAENNGSYAITAMGGFHEIQGMYNYVPLVHIQNHEGDSSRMYGVARTGYCSWEIISGTQNPQEIVKYADFLATKQGKTLWQYGLEGQTFDYNSDGFPRMREDVYNESVEDGMAFKDKWGFSPSGGFMGWILGSTDNDAEVDFGERLAGIDYNIAEVKKAEILELVEPETVTLKQMGEGRSALAFLGDPEMAEITPNLDAVINNEEWAKMLVQAVVAKTEAESEKIIASYLDTLYKAGLQEYKDFLQSVYDKDPEAITFYRTENY